jgi:hypothetical protein
MMKTIVASLLLGIAAMATAAEPPEDTARRAALRQERQAIQQAHASRQAACRDTFAVNNCLAKARTDMQTAMKRVHEQELELNEAARERRAAANAERLNAKAATARARQETAASAPLAGEGAASGQRRPTARRGIDLGGTGKPAAPHSAEEEQRSRERFEARQREIREHREEVEKRNADKTRSSPPSRSLPVPTAASAAAGG